MTAELLDGKALAATIQARNRERVADLPARLGYSPRVAVLLVGDDLAGDLYARRIARSCKEAGLTSTSKRLDEAVGTDAVLDLLDEWRRDREVCGVVVQMPLPPSIDSRAVVDAIDSALDIDGISPVNFGRMALGLEAFVPCTAEAIVEIARASGVPLVGARCVVVGRSNIVGKPAALLMLREHATVTICHTRTKDLAGVVRQAEVVVAAAGQPGLIRGAMLAPGCTVIDAGTTPTSDGLKGDVETSEAAEVAALLTPVPGGVGPVTNAVLIRHAVESAERLASRA